MQKIHFFNYDRKPALKNRQKLKLFIQELFAGEGKQLGSLSYIFCSDEHLLGINKEFLKHDFYTDVVTFELSPPGTETEGEVYLSVDRIRDNANKLGLSFNEELHRVIFHGALHLCGYRDKTKEEVWKMRTKEETYLRSYFS